MMILFTKVATMTDMKCPFCGHELQEDVGYDGDYSCPNCGQPYFGSPELWQELIRTRKALEIAVDALKKYTDASGNWWYGYEFQGHYEDYAGEYADKALEQITALEQKDK